MDARTGSTIEIVNEAQEVETNVSNISLPELRLMAVDQLWDIRLKAIVEIKLQIERAYPPYFFKNGTFLGNTSYKNFESKSSSSTHPVSMEYAEGVVDILVAKIGDPHNTVAMAALEGLFLLTFPIKLRDVDDTQSINSDAYVPCPILISESALGKLGYMMPALFARLADRRGKVKDKANEILNNIRVSLFLLL